MAQPGDTNVEGPLQIVRNGREHMQKFEGTHDVGNDYVAAAAITSGDLVELTAGGLQPHSTAAGVVARPLVAVDMREVGMEAGDAYAAGNTVKAMAPYGGGLWMRLAQGENVDIHERLVSAGDGTLRALDTAGGDAELATVCVAVRPTDNSGGSGPMWVPVAFA